MIGPIPRFIGAAKVRLLGFQRGGLGTEGTIDDLTGEWSNDSTVVCDRTLEFVRVTHFIAGPVVVAVMMFTRPEYLLMASSAAYFLGLLLIGWLVSRDLQAGLMALVDMAMIGLAALVVFPPGAALVLLAMAATMGALSYNKLQVLGESRHSMLRVADLIDSVPVIVWESEPDGDVLKRVIGRVEPITGYTPSQWLAMTVVERVHADDVERFRDARLAAERVDDPVVSEVRLRHLDGTYTMVREVIRMVTDGGERYLRGVTLDVAEEAAARLAVDRMAAAVDNQSDPLVVVAPRASIELEPTVLHMNPAFSRLAGITASTDQGQGQGLWTVAPWLPRTVRADLDDLVTTGRASDRDDLSIATPLGTRNYDFEIVPLPDGSAAIQFTDVTDRKHAIELIRHQAFHDPLTALPNRTLLFDRLSQALAATTRDGSSVGLLLLDLNQFKEINDTLGHAYGDQLLTTIGSRLALMVRPQDTVARLGGDEFAMVISGASVAQMDEIAQRVTAELHRPVNLGGIDVEVSASIGGAVAPLHGDEPHLLLQRADVAMYDAKHSGQTYRLYVPDDDRHSVDRLTLMGDLKGLLDDELRVWFQPKIDLRSGRTSGLEALARWQHPRMGLLGPGQFIELCQLSGLISELTFRVLDLSLAAIADWPGQSVAVNVPVRNLYDRTLPEVVSQKLTENGLEPDRLMLEITESEIMEDHRTIAEVLEELHALGVGISIDDFGTGFSSLTHLRRLSVDEIKIDQSFVMGMLDNENDYMIARSIIDLAHNLGHRVVAEGVEDSATLTLLRELGCDVGQGYLFSKPGPIERIRNQVETGPALDDVGALIWHRQ